MSKPNSLTDPLAILSQAVHDAQSALERARTFATIYRDRASELERRAIELEEGLTELLGAVALVSADRRVADPDHTADHHRLADDGGPHHADDVHEAARRSHRRVPRWPAGDPLAVKLGA